MPLEGVFGVSLPPSEHGQKNEMNHFGAVFNEIICLVVHLA